MTNSEFMNILNDDSLELTVEELENIIDEELQKDESEMDPDLIEYCLSDNSRHYRTAARHHRNCDYCHRQRNQKQRHYLLRKSYKSSFR